MTESKIVVIGAGIGGLTAAALLAKEGFDVTILEAQAYPGGCASTFPHKGFLFESGATVVGGFQPGGPHAVLAELLAINFPIHKHDPAWVTHLPDRSIALSSDNNDVLEKFPGTEKFWDEQQKIATIAWKLSAQGLPWPPRSIPEFTQLLKVGLNNFPQDLQVIPFALSSVYQWLERLGLHKNEAFVRFLDAQLLISAQTTTQNVNALYGATALDLARQGVYHVCGGIGGIAQALVNRFESFGGQIHYRHHVSRIEVQNGKAIGVYVRKGRHTKQEKFISADFVIANTTPWNLHELLGEFSTSGIKREVVNRPYGWGAFVLHLGVKAGTIPLKFPDHHQVISNYDSPLGEGNSIFMSLSPTWDTSRAPKDERAVTITTHTNVRHWWEILNTDENAYDARKAHYSEQILQLVDKIIPGFRDNITLNLPGTPVTYNFYTSRYKGMVGGFPQTSLFKARGSQTGISNIRLVGDSIFPGQSTAGVTLGGMRVAEDVRNSLRLSVHSSDSKYSQKEKRA